MPTASTSALPAATPLAVGTVPPVCPASTGGTSLFHVEGMDTTSGWIDGRYIVADDWGLV
jgi:hypothetical protein